jgi:hypothetical protein
VQVHLAHEMHGLADAVCIAVFVSVLHDDRLVRLVCKCISHIEYTAWLTLSASSCLPLLFRDGAEQLSVDRAMRAVSRAEIVVIVLDGSEGVTQQVRAVHIMLMSTVNSGRSSLQGFSKQLE